MNRLWIVCLLAIGLLSVATDVGAAGGKKGNAKGAAKQTPEQLFAKLDTDSDKSLSPDELAAWGAFSGATKKKGDKGQGGSDAAADAAKKNLAEFDNDKNGKLSLNEFLTARLVLAAKAKETKKKK